MRSFIFAGILAAAGITAADAQTLDRIRDSSTINIGYRADAVPFSYVDGNGEPRGYTVDLCGEVAREVGLELGIDDLNVNPVEVGTEDRFTAIEDGTIDILCGATTVTFERREIVDFSLLTFVTGSTVMYRADGPASFEAMEGQRIGVRGATTTEAGLEGALTEAGINADIVTFDDHDTAINALSRGEIEAYFADRAILIFSFINRGEPADLQLSNRVFSNEPYALALARGDVDFRLVVDRALSRTYQTQRIEEIYAANFGRVPPTDLLRTLFRLNSFPF